MSETATCHAVVARLARLFGADAAQWMAARATDPDGRPVRVVHSAAAWRDPSTDVLHLVKIAPHGPKSATDWFLFNAARARADVTLTTGGNLRAEPHVSMDLAAQHCDELAEALASFRADVTGRPGLPPWPRVAVMTRSPPGDAGAEGGDAAGASLARHRFVNESNGPVVWCPTDPRTTLRRLCAVAAETAPRGAIPTVLVEAGGSAMELYGQAVPTDGGSDESACIVTELVLSLYGGPLAPDLVGPALAPLEFFETRLARVTPWATDSPADAWQFAFFRAR